MGGGGEDKKVLPASFSPVTSTNIGISPKNILNFSFTPFDRLVQNFKFVPSASRKLFNLSQDHPSKKAVFLDKSLQSWGYDNLPSTNARATKLWSHDHIHNILWFMWQSLLVTSYIEYRTEEPLFQNTVILRRAGVPIFADIIKTLTTFVIIIYKDSRKIKMNRNYVSKYNLYLYFLI